MTLFAQKLAQSATDPVYLITQSGGGDIEHFSCVLSVPKLKEPQLLHALKSADTFQAERFGSVLYYGAGLLDEAEAAKLI